MEYRVVIVCLFALVLLCNARRSVRRYYKVNNYIIDKYVRVPNQKLIPPLLKNGNVVVVEHGLSINRIVDMDTEREVLSLDVWESMKWQDERLSWEHDSKAASIKKVFVPVNMIWIPDMVLDNRAGSPQPHTDVLVEVLSNGTVIYVPPELLKSSCPVSTTISAGDLVTCKLMFGSWVYDEGEMETVAARDTADTTAYIDSNRNWELVGTKASRIVIVYKEWLGFKDVTIQYEIKLKRKNYI